MPRAAVAFALDLAFTYVPLRAMDSALVSTTAAALQPPLVLDAQGNGSVPLAIPNATLRHLDAFAQGAAFVGGGLVLTAPAVVHTL